VIRIKLRSVAAASTALVAVTVGSVVIATPAQAQSSLDWFYSTKSYPYPYYNSGTSPAGFTKGWCADYASWAFEHWTGSRFYRVKVNGISLSTFKSSVLKKGFKYGTKPRTGAMAVQLTGGPHFAYVYSYKAGAKTFKVREVRWNTTGPSFRNVSVSKIGKTRAGFQLFIYKK
jgi:hypothetical protein